MLVVDSLLLGFVAGFLRGGSLARLSSVRLRFEIPMMTLLVAQLSLPGVVDALDWPRELSISIWILVMVLLTIAVLLNWRERGMVIAALGISFNALVICVNGGMPVSISAVEQVSGSPVAEEWLAEDLVHVALRDSTLFPALADIIPMPGPRWHRGVISPGDILLSLGIVVFLSRAMTSARVT